MELKGSTWMIARFNDGVVKADDAIHVLVGWRCWKCAASSAGDGMWAYS